MSGHYGKQLVRPDRRFNPLKIPKKLEARLHLLHFLIATASFLEVLRAVRLLVAVSSVRVLWNLAEGKLTFQNEAEVPAEAEEI